MTPAWPYVTNSSSCAHTLFSHKHRIFEACSFEIYNPTPNPFIIPLPSSSLIPHTCALQTMAFNLPAIKHYVTSVSTTLQFQHHMPLPPFNGSQHINHINLTLLNVPHIPHIPYSPTQRPLFFFGYPILVTFMGMTILAVGTIVIILYVRTNTPTTPNDSPAQIYPDLNTLNIKISADD